LTKPEFSITRACVVGSTLRPDLLSWAGGFGVGVALKPGRGCLVAAGVASDRRSA
jgi:hypothetical protein